MVRKLRTFGGLSMEQESSKDSATLNRRPLSLLALLAVKGRRGLSRDSIIALLWPESDLEPVPLRFQFHGASVARVFTLATQSRRLHGAQTAHVRRSVD